MRAEKAHERVYEYRRDGESVETREELVERKKRKNIKSTLVNRHSKMCIKNRRAFKKNNNLETLSIV